MENFIEIGIVDTRNIVKTIKDNYGYDLTNYALTSLKRRLERVLLLHNIKNPDTLIVKLKESSDYYTRFLKDFLVETTEMFRDPSLWRWLRDNYFKEMFNLNSSFKIWLPDCVGGDELFSLCILLKEENMLDKFDIIASSINNYQIEKVKSGECPIKKIETGAENYKRFNGFGDFSIYYKTDDNFAYRDKKLIENVEFKMINIAEEVLPKHLDIIIYRNHFIYYNQTLQDDITVKLMNSLKSGGLFIIGNKEILGRQFLNDFVLINHSESVYKKR